MFAPHVLFATLVLCHSLMAQASAPRNAPFYSIDSIVNSADSLAGVLAANTIATIYGSGLSYVTRSLSAQDISGGVLPGILPGTGVTVLIGGLPANIYYVSPTQINFLIPSILRPGPTDLQTVLNGIAGPVVPLALQAASPAIFQADAQTVIATRLDGSLITADVPALPGDIVTLYATGLGDTTPPVVYGNLAIGAAPLKRLAEFTVSLDGMTLDPTLILYAGIAPGFAGLYQINLRLPSGGINRNPILQIALGSAISPAGLKLPYSP